MLNELFIAEQCAAAAGVDLPLGHSEICVAGKVPTLQVRLDSTGVIVSVRPLPTTISPWTQRNGKKNSFPFVKMTKPLWMIPQDDPLLKRLSSRNLAEKHDAILEMGAEAQLNEAAFQGWPPAALMKRIDQRLGELHGHLSDTAGTALISAMERFLKAFCDPDSTRFIRNLSSEIIAELRDTADQAWVEIAKVILVGRGSSPALLFDSTCHDPIYSTDVREALAAALRLRDRAQDQGSVGSCALTGKPASLFANSDNAPQPKLPEIGETILFSRNKDSDAAWRYGQFGAASMPVGRETLSRLAAAADTLTAELRMGKTWRSIPSEQPENSDLLFAFAEGAPDAELTDVMAEDDPVAEEVTSTSEHAGQLDTVSAFQKRASRIVDAFRAHVEGDFRQLPVLFFVLRKVDPANRKVVYSNTFSVGDLYDAAIDWERGCRNVPTWLRLPEKKGVQLSPRIVAPLSLTPMSRKLFTLDGQPGKKDVIGIPASDALALFFDCGPRALSRARRILKLFLDRRRALLAAVAHAQFRRGNAIFELDRREAIRTVTVLGLLLYKLEPKGHYMESAAFRLGQLLSMADAVHAGYCADVRAGDIPAALLGNQVFFMAQRSPTKALAMLARRWKPYEGWARRSTRAYAAAEKLVNSKKKDERSRGYAIYKGLRVLREVRPFSQEVEEQLDDIHVDEAFRAKLLLGYLAGISRAEDKNEDTESLEEKESE